MATNEEIVQALKVIKEVCDYYGQPPMCCKGCPFKIEHQCGICKEVPKWWEIQEPKTFKALR